MSVWLDTAEPVEIALVLVALTAMLLGSGLFVRAYETAVVAEVDGRCEAVQRLAWLRVRNEAIRLMIVGLVFTAGVIQLMQPMPLVPTVQRGWLQVIWVLIALGCLVQSLTNERTIKRVIGVIERERASGRMR